MTVATLLEPLDRELCPEEIARAAHFIDAEFRDTPQFEWPSSIRRFGGRVVVKVESINPIGSFKARGAQYLMSQLPGRPHIVCATAGNFGQGLSYAARQIGCPITVFTNTSASPIKIERMRALGACVRMEGETPNQAHAAAQAFAGETGALLVEDGRHPSISEGAGTIAIELLRWPESFDAILVPLGDGALLGGMATWVKAHSPSTRMIGVAATGSPSMACSWRVGTPVTAPCATIADGIAVDRPFEAAVARLQGPVDDVMLVDDAAFIEAMRLAHRELGLVLEPSGAAGLAAILSYPQHFKQTLVGVVLTGGNLTEEEMLRWLCC